MMKMSLLSGRRSERTCFRFMHMNALRNDELRFVGNWHGSWDREFMCIMIVELSIFKVLLEKSGTINDIRM